MIDTGDVVKHEPTGEEWLVACVVDDRLSWVGWPEGYAKLADCTLIEKAAPDRRQYWLEKMAASDQSDHRARYAKERLANPDPR